MKYLRLTKQKPQEENILELPCIIFGNDVQDLSKRELQKFRDVAKAGGYPFLIELNVRDSKIVFGKDKDAGIFTDKMKFSNQIRRSDD